MAMGSAHKCEGRSTSPGSAWLFAGRIVTSAALIVVLGLLGLFPVAIVAAAILALNRKPLRAISQRWLKEPKGSDS